MTVYVVIFRSSSDESFVEVRGVYSTLELAEQRKNSSSIRHCYYIEELDIDQDY